MMNKRVWLSLIAACVVVGTIAAAQAVGRSSSSSHGSSKQSHRVVFDVSLDGAERWDGVLNNVENLRHAFGERNTEVEVVVHGKALPLLQRTNTAMSERMRDLSEKGVTFAACENTMRRMNVTREMLLPFAVTVDAGVAELVRKQEAGWAYIKAGG